MGSLQFSVARPKSPLSRVLAWWWVPAIPAGLFVLVLIFLGVNRIGNTFPEPDAVSAEQEAPADPFEEAYVRDPELYFTVWERDTAGNRQTMLEDWQAELDELRVESMTGEKSDDQVEREQQLSQAIEDLQSRQ